jgi:hypothetical protein
MPVFGMNANTTTGKTDDRGEYRISPLRAGDYIVCACTRDPVPFDDTLLRTIGGQPAHLIGVGARALAGGADTVALDGTLKTYAPTFYPAAATLDRAEVVRLAPGEERETIDLQVPLVRAARISGRVVGAPGPVHASSIALSAEGGDRSSFFRIPPMLVQPDGRFDFASVPPGTYRLTVTHRDGGRGAAVPTGEALRFLGGAAAFAPPAGGRGRAGAEPQPPLWGEQLIVVSDRDISNLDVILQQGTRVSGRVAWEGPAPEIPLRQQIVIGLTGVDDSTGREVATVGADHTFAVTLRPGKYSVQLLSGPATHRMKSVTLGGSDLTGLSFDVGAREVGGLAVTLSDEPETVLTVSAATVGTARAPEGFASVFPADRRYWQFPVAAAERFRLLPLTSEGSATIRGLPPGEYFVAFGAESVRVDFPSSSRLESLSRQASRVTLAPGSVQVVEVRR